MVFDPFCKSHASPTARKTLSQKPIQIPYNHLFLSLCFTNDNTFFIEHTATKTDIQTIRKKEKERKKKSHRRKRTKNITKKIFTFHPPNHERVDIHFCYVVIYFLFNVSAFIFESRRARGILGVLFLYIVAEARPNCEVPEGHFTCILQLRGRIVSFLFLFFTPPLRMLEYGSQQKRFVQFSVYICNGSTWEELCCS